MSMVAGRHIPAPLIVDLPELCGHHGELHFRSVERQLVRSLSEAQAVRDPGWLEPSERDELAHLGSRCVVLQAVQLPDGEAWYWLEFPCGCRFAATMAEVWLD